uniref:CSON015015 protein n=1 Tax=Culicoides sonorensis TaxID=179676 RepID=A0A336MDK9_CULSO
MRYFNTNYIISILFISLLTLPHCYAVIEDVLDVLRLSKEIVSSIAGTWNLVEQTPLTNDIDLPFLKRKEKKILLKITEVQRRIDLTENQMKNTASWTIESIKEHMKDNTKLDLAIHELMDLMNRISAQSKMLRHYTEHRDELEQVTLETTATWIVSPNIGAVQGILNRIHLLVSGSSDLKYFGKNSLLEMLVEQLELKLQQLVMVCLFVRSNN